MIHAKALLAGAVIIVCIAAPTITAIMYPWVAYLLLSIVVSYLLGWLYLILSGKWEEIN